MTARTDAVGHASEPSRWVRRWSHMVAPGASVLDLACGGGRHTRWFAGRGARVVAVDRDTAAVAGLAGIAAETLVVDLEADVDVDGAGGWRFAGSPARRFDAVVVTNYLWRPLLPAIVAAVASGGVLIYETFGAGQAALGRPQRPAFLLNPGELLDAVRQGPAPLQVVAYQDGLLDAPLRQVQRIVAVRAPRAATRLDGSG